MQYESSSPSPRLVWLEFLRPPRAASDDPWTRLVLVLGVALWRGPPAPADAAVDGPLTRVEGALSALTGALERLQDFLDGMAASSLNHALGRAGLAAPSDPGVEGQLLTQCRGC